MKLLIVDDEKDVVTMFRQRFRKEIKAGEIELAFAISAEEALTHLARADLTGSVLILSDINMPGMSGFELLKIIKEKYRKLKVVMVTAYGDEKSRQEALEYGADGFIVKPVDFQVLKEKIFSLE